MIKKASWLKKNLYKMKISIITVGKKSPKWIQAEILTTTLIKNKTNNDILDMKKVIMKKKK